MSRYRLMETIESKGEEMNSTNFQTVPICYEGVDVRREY